ncbi:MAG: tRNA (N6-threonylcarbamoyladenosine(37)-N6)-methyltransferase TrmO, partial [Negativicutes bacterium]
MKKTSISATITNIARIRTDFPTKFGVPRQSGLVPLEATIVFEPPYRDPSAVRGLEGFSHLWLIWQFSEAMGSKLSPTVRPPRLGGNTRMGVFATRSPFRPNHLGLSSVKLDRIEMHPQWGPVLHVLGADMVDQTPIFDIKPYLPYVDSHPDAAGGFADPLADHKLQVVFPARWLVFIPEHLHKGLYSLLA